MARARISLWWIAPVVAVAVGGGVTIGVTLGGRRTPTTSSLAATHKTSGASRASLATRTGTTASSGARGASGASGSSGSSGSVTTTSAAPRRHRPVAPLRVLSTTPAAKATGVAGAGPITVRLSAPVASGSPTPTLSPATPGTWSVHGDTMTFTPSVPFIPLSQVTLTVPAGPTGPRGAAGGAVAHAYKASFQVQNGSLFRLDQLMSLLAYSPLAWSPTGPAIAPTNRAAQIRAMYHAPVGSFAWRQAGWPQSLTALWAPGQYNVMLKGLVMSFQADHGLTPNGTLTGGLWNDLLGAVAQHELNTGGYNFAVASKVLPESLTIWHDGKVVLHAPANTGISVDPTTNGVFPVYERLRNQVMQGTNPNGSHYADPVQFVAYFYGGEAVHYIPRAYYGAPQSLGCVELDLADAATAWPYLAYGTLVDVVA